MKILITGGTGSVGKILVPMLLDKNYDLTFIDLGMGNNPVNPSSVVDIELKNQ